MRTTPWVTTMTPTTKARKRRPLIVKQGRRRISAQQEVMRQDRERTAFERRLEIRLRRAFAAYGREAQAEFISTQTTQLADAMLPAKLEKALYPHYRQTIIHFGRSTLAMLVKQDDSMFETLADRYIFTLGAVAVRRVSSTQKGFMRRIISASVAEGLGIEQTARRILRGLVNGPRAILKARVIARTETHAAATYASHETAASLGIPELRKRWVAILAGGRTRQSHIDMNGVDVAMDEKFMVPSRTGVDAMDRPGDPAGSPGNLIQCRCLCVYFEPEDVIVP